MGTKLEYNELSDADLLVLIKDRNKMAFSVIYRRYWPPLFLHANRILKDKILAQDTVQEVFMSLFQRQEELDITTSLKSFLYKAVQLTILKQFRHAKVRERYEQDLATFLSGSFCLADEELLAKELADIIDTEIEKMPPRMQEIFNLSRKEYLSRKEIAELLNISEGTVRTQIQRALKILQSNRHLGMSMNLMTVISLFHHNY